MRRTGLVLASAVSLAFFAACGSGDGAVEAEPTSAPVASVTPSPTSASNATPVSSGATPTPTPTLATATAGASPTTAAPTAPATSAPQPTAVANTPVAQPTPTVPAQGGNPTSATMGVTGTSRYFWSPNSVKIAPGGTVTFAWSGGAAHDVSVPALGFESPGNATVSGSYTVTFPSAGTFDVICVIHVDTMKGKVVVQ